MRFLWRTYCLPVLDYCSQLWSPIEGPLLNKLETLQRSFTARVQGLKHLNYWDRMKVLKIQSIQRRFERYKVIYAWKIVRGLVPNCGLKWYKSPYNGTYIDVPEIRKYLK